MKVDKFNENCKPYELTGNGELIEISDIDIKKYRKTPNMFLTDEEYIKIKKLADNTKELCDLMDENKKQYVNLLRGAIQKIKSKN